MGLFPGNTGIGCAAAHGEIIACNDNIAAIQLAATADEIARAEIDDIAFVVIGSGAGKRTHFAERAVIQQGVYPFPNRQLAIVMMPVDLFLAAHAIGKLFAFLELFDFLFPGHAVIPSPLVCYWVGV